VVRCAWPKTPAVAANPKFLFGLGIRNHVATNSGCNGYTVLRAFYCTFRCAKQCVAEHQGSLPTTLEALQNLPGIGRSTAAAILSLAHGQAEPILDGNVKRVLARHQTIDGWPGQSAVLKRLWALSEALTPNQRTGEFNQAMMDLGATLCTRTKPRCADCPVAADCGALANGTPTQYPGKKPKKDKPVMELAGSGCHTVRWRMVSAGWIKDDTETAIG